MNPWAVAALALDFALEVLARLGFDKETRERHVYELANEMYLRQHPSRNQWKFGLEGWNDK